jgi:hypothetical protein
LLWLQLLRPQAHTPHTWGLQLLRLLENHLPTNPLLLELLPRLLYV